MSKINLTEDQASISILDFNLILAAANGQIDLNDLARKHVANCGLDLNGKWVGFKTAHDLLTK